MNIQDVRQARRSRRVIYRTNPRCHPLSPPRRVAGHAGRRPLAGLRRRLDASLEVRSAFKAPLDVRHLALDT